MANVKAAFEKRRRSGDAQAVVCSGSAGDGSADHDSRLDPDGRPTVLDKKSSS